jgi:hypothetical protein
MGAAGINQASAAQIGVFSKIDTKLKSCHFSKNGAGWNSKRA